MPAFKPARYGPPDRYAPPPGAGMCLSVFAVARRGRHVLAGRAARDARWFEDWMPSWPAHSEEDVAAMLGQTRLPSAYLREGEHPDDALGRVMREQLRVRAFRASPPRVFSFVSPSDWYPGHEHWDLAFVYDVRASAPARVPPWWRELGWRDLRGVAPEAFGWSGDLVEMLGLLGKRRASSPPKRRKVARRRASAAR